MAGRRPPASLSSNTLLVPAARATAALGPNNRILVYSGVNARPEDFLEDRGRTGGCRPEEASVVCEVAWESGVFNEVTSKLVSEAHGVFLKLQEVGQLSSASRSSSLLHLSRQYRAVIHACVLGLRQQAEDESTRGSPSNEAGPDFLGQSRLFASMELIWHLCEVVLLEVMPGGCAIQPMLEWVGWHCTYAEQVAKQILSLPEPSEHKSYWNAIQLLVLHGRVDIARNLLLHWPGRKPGTGNPCGSLEELLRKMPVPQTLFGQSLAEFSLRWKRWQQDVHGRLAAGHFAAAPQVEQIALMLVGDEEALDYCKPLCESWYELFVGKLLYKNPTVKAVDLQYSVAEIFMSREPSPLDRILKSVMEFDVHAVIKECSDVLAPLSWWFSAHLTDLLHHCGQLEVYHMDYGSDLREFLLLEFASSLMNHSTLWQVGATYFDHCPTMGRAYLESFIERIPLTSEKKALKILSVCQQRDMTEQVCSVCRVMAKKSLQQGRLGTALNWCIRSKDSQLASHLADKLLNQYSEQGIFEHLDLIDNLGSSMLLDNRLTFLAKYREFHQLYNQQKFREAGDLLFMLLDSRLAPTEFWPTILLDALPLLEMDEVIFSSDQTYEFMYCLEEVKMGRNHKAANKKDPDAMQTDDEPVVAQMSDKLDLLNLVLARNLARAIIAQAS